MLEAVGRAEKAASLRDASLVVARLFNVYGPRETNPHLIPRILGEIRRGNCIRLGNLWPRRDYIHVADAVEALVALEKVEVSASFEVFNVGTGVTASVEEVVRLLGEILRVRLQPEVDVDRVRSFDRRFFKPIPTRFRELQGGRSGTRSQMAYGKCA